MPSRRKLAAELLRAALRFSSSANREWTLAMLREFDEIDRDWEALWWGIGSIAFVFMDSVGNVSAREVAKVLLGFVFGAGIAVLSVAGAIGIPFGTFRLFPIFAERTDWLPWLILIVLPIVASAAIGAKVAPKRRSIAAGLLCAAIALGVHLTMRVATHGPS